MSVRDNMLMVGFRSRDRLRVVIAHTWEELFRRLGARERGLQ
jgi:hypothetical protein